MTRKMLVLIATLSVGLGPTFVGAQGRGNGNGRAQNRQAANTRFEGVDRNNDGRITRAEWSGSDQSFRQHDWNNDGVLTGDEMRPGADRYNVARDRESDNRDQFEFMDRNNDNRISRNEWTGTFVQFDRLDRNNDDYLTRSERLNADAPADLFASLDVNRDRVVTRNEWRRNLGVFDRFDVNNDQRLTRQELMNPRSTAPDSSAYRTGYSRGVAEGRQAGVEDRVNNHGWDLEGQRELESANSGYSSAMGPMSDYQAGYREGFRRAYPDGFRG